MGKLSKLRRLERVMRGNLDHIELVDGSRYFFEPGEVWSEVFKHGSDSLTADYRSEPRPEPPPILEAVARAKDRKSAAGRLYPAGGTPFTAYDLDALVERGEFVPRSFLAGHTFEESRLHFARKNAEKE